MARRRKGRDVHGVVLLDKPVGISSNRALQQVRAMFQARKAGHTGSLDPFATGMLPICLGEATKTAGLMLDASKTYTATALLGVATATGDTEGEVVDTCALPPLDSEQIRSVLKRFSGPIEQVPPMYSALKHEGQPLYKLARQGITVERKSRPVTIHSLELLTWEPPRLTFRVHCSKGTYVRTLGEDIARALGTCAHLVALRRDQVDPFTEQSMVSMDALDELQQQGQLQKALLGVDSGLSGWPKIQLDEPGSRSFQHGNPVSHQPPGQNPEPTPVRVYGRAGHLLGLGEIDVKGELKPIRVMNLPAPDAKPLSS